MESETLLDKTKKSADCCKKCCYSGRPCSADCKECCFSGGAYAVFNIHMCTESDGGNTEPLRSWVALLAVFIFNVTLAMFETTFGIYFGYIEDKFESNAARVALIPSIFLALVGFAGFIAGPFVVVYGCRPVAVFGSCVTAAGVCLAVLAPSLAWFIVLYAGVGACGIGFTYIAAMTVLQQSFPYHRGLATGVSTLGYTVGTVLGPVIVQNLLEEWGLSGALLLNSGIIMHGIVCSMAMDVPTEYTCRESHSPAIQDDKQNGDQNDRDERKTAGNNSRVQQGRYMLRKNIVLLATQLKDVSLFKNPQFILCIFQKGLWEVSILGLSAHLVSAAILKDIAEKDAAYLIVIVGLANLVARLTSTLVLHADCFHPVVDLVIGMLLLTTSAFVAATARTYYTFVIAAVLLGACEGVVTAPFYVVIFHIVGVEKYATGLALLELTLIPFYFVGAPFAGWLRVLTGHYMASFYMLGAASTISTVLAAIMYTMYKIHGTMWYPGDPACNDETQPSSSAH